MAPGHPGPPSASAGTAQPPVISCPQPFPNQKPKSLSSQCLRARDLFLPQACVHGRLTCCPADRAPPAGTSIWGHWSDSQERPQGAPRTDGEQGLSTCHLSPQTGPAPPRPGAKNNSTVQFTNYNKCHFIGSQQLWEWVVSALAALLTGLLPSPPPRPEAAPPPHTQLASTAPSAPSPERWWDGVLPMQTQPHG